MLQLLNCCSEVGLGMAGIAGGLGVDPPLPVQQFCVKIGFKVQFLCKISNISTYDHPVLLGQFQRWA